MRRLDPQARWLRRFIRGRRLDRNPLRRASGRAETVVLAGLLTAFLAGAPFAVLAGGNLVQDSTQHLRQVQLATRSYVTATTLEAMPTLSGSRGSAFTIPAVEAQWTAPDGKLGLGEVPVPFGTPTGARERVWTTADGRLAGPPLTSDQVASLTTLGQTMSAIAVIALLWLAWALARKELDRRRFAAWDADWRAVNSHGRQRK